MEFEDAYNKHFIRGLSVTYYRVSSIHAPEVIQSTQFEF